MNRSPGLLMFAALALLPQLASAQPTDATRERVEEHLRRGVELRRTGHDDEAVAEFEAAYRLAPGPRTTAQLGLARQAVGAWLDADRLLRESLASTDDPWVSRNRAALESMLAVTANHLGTLEVRANVPGASVVMDGVTVATLPMSAPLRVLSGVVSLEVTAPGYAAVARRFVVDPGSTVRESVTLRPLAPPTLTPHATPPLAARLPATSEPLAQRPWWRRWAWAPTVAGGVSLALAGVALAAREDAAVRYNSARCPPPPPPTPSTCADLNSAASTWEATAWIAGASGTALLAAGVVMYVVPARGERRASLACAPTGAGALCELRF